MQNQHSNKRQHNDATSWPPSVRAVPDTIWQYAMRQRQHPACICNNCSTWHRKGAQCKAISTSNGSQRGCVIMVVDCHDDQVINSSCFQISTTAATKCLLVTVLLEGQISHSSNNHVLFRVCNSANHLHAHACIQHGSSQNYSSLFQTQLQRQPHSSKKNTAAAAQRAKQTAW